MKIDNIQERRQKVLQFIQSSQVVTITDICDFMQTSESTIRRDIDWLEESKKISRFHGSIFISNGQYDLFDIRSKRFSDEKMRIGEYAASLISNGDLIYVGAGTTMRQFAINLIARKDLSDITVVSSAVNVAACIAGDPRFEVMLLPGILKSTDEMLQATGKTLSNIREFNFNKAITGSSGIVPNRGVMMPASHYAETTKAAYEQSSEVIVLADHSKFGNLDPYVVCGLDQIDRIICDKHPDVETIMRTYEKYFERIDFV